MIHKIHISIIVPYLQAEVQKLKNRKIITFFIIPRLYTNNHINKLNLKINYLVLLKFLK